MPTIKTQFETFVLNLPGPTIPLEEQIRRGNHKYSNPAINAGNFQLTIPAGKREVVLYDPRGYVSSEEMIRRMEADGYKPATLDDCLAMGAQHPDRQRQNPIVFLGSVWCDPVGYRHVPVLDDWGGVRLLLLCWFDDGWSDVCRVAAVREK